MNRMYVVETMPTVTGFKAEHRLALKPSEIAKFATGAGEWQRLRRAASAGCSRSSSLRCWRDLKASGRQVRGDSGRAGFAGGACCGVCAELLRWARWARR